MGTSSALKVHADERVTPGTWRAENPRLDRVRVNRFLCYRGRTEVKRPVEDVFPSSTLPICGRPQGSPLLRQTSFAGRRAQDTLRCHPFQHTREGNGLADVVQTTDPGHQALDTHPKPSMRH